jgi:hypothetical protein
MFHDVAEDPGSLAPEELLELYEAELVGVIEEHGVAEVAGSSGVDESTLRALESGDSPELNLEEASAVMAVAEGTADAETIATVSRDALLMGMTTAVLDVEAVESGIGGRLEAREIQSKIEGRFPLTLGEFALLQQYIESEK